ncbi:hypothetical protein ACFL27_06755 [candidate division CSSED10-310 bacterium]|uniref:Uncharacterized protein n=1 Tax=candidate division CSSED10-310 bacterium TaxID=2855610 RepID=A0ABV6YUK8_UNCC1
MVIWKGLGEIQGQRFTSTGNRAGSQFQVNAYTTSNQGYPDVSFDNEGDFVVVWDSFGSNYGDTSNNSVQAQRFNADGSFLGSQFQVNTYTYYSQFEPAVNMDNDGDFVVVWSSISNYTDTSNTSIQAQRFSSDGNIVGSQFQVNTYTTGRQFEPEASIDEDGDFVVVWYSLGSNYGDTSSLSIQGRQFSFSANPVPSLRKTFAILLLALLGLSGVYFLINRKTFLQ